MQDPVQTTTTQTQVTSTEDTSTLPPESFQATATTLDPTANQGGIPKSRMNKKVVATIFGILLLIGGVGAGLVLVNQQQIFQQKAAANGCLNYTGTGGYGGTPDTITLNATGENGVPCDGYTLIRFTGPSCPTTANPGNPSTVSAGSGPYQPHPTNGQCEQVDLQGSGGGGVCSCVGGGGGGGNSTPKTCGQTCSADSECQSPSPAGATVKCINNKCSNMLCATDTEDGANCGCKVGINACGQQCGLGLGLCTGGAACNFLQGPFCHTGACANENDPNCQRFCNNPTNVNGPGNGYKLKPCADAPGASYLVDANDNVATTRQDAVSQCSPQICGDAYCNTGELCERTAVGANTFKMCETSDNRVPTGSSVASCSLTGANACTPSTPSQFMCMNITKDIVAPKLGDTVKFTCNASEVADTYDFRYKIDSGAYQTLTTSATGSNISSPLTVSTMGTYLVECRPCKTGVCLAFNAAGVTAATTPPTATTPPSATSSPVGTLNNGLVGYWKLDDTSLPGGGTALDSSGQGNNGTSAGIVKSTASGKFGRAALYSGVSGNEWITMGNPPALNLTTAVTLSAWIKTSSLNYRGGIISKTGAGDGHGSWLLEENVFDCGSGRLNFFLMSPNSGNNPNGNMCSASALTTNTWYLVTATYDGVTRSLYINGVLNAQGSYPGGINITTEPVILGNWSGENQNRTWDGSIDDVRIYNRALSAAEVQQLYNLVP